MRRSPRLRRPRLRTLLLFLLLGAAVNVAVAWGCAMRFDPCTARMTLKQVMDHDRCVVTEGNQITVGHERISKYFGDVWSMPDAITSSMKFPALSEDYSGWPFAALRCQSRQSIIFFKQNAMAAISPITSVGVDGGIALPCCFVHSAATKRLGRPPHPNWRGLPLTPLWPGFAINTVFYAAILWGGWLLFAAPFAVRRRRRIKRGLCPACAYPVGTSNLCTECGKPVSPTAVTPGVG